MPSPIENSRTYIVAQQLLHARDQQIKRRDKRIAELEAALASRELEHSRLNDETLVHTVAYAFRDPKYDPPSCRLCKDRSAGIAEYRAAVLAAKTVEEKR